MKELQLKIIYAMIVAGKNAKFANAVIEKMFAKYSDLPFNVIRRWDEEGKLLHNLYLHGTGNYRKLDKGLSQLVRADIDLVSCKPEDLEKIYGIGPKTSRFFILWTRPDEEYAVLDVHILRWMKKQGYDAPETTPSSSTQSGLKKYLELEEAFLVEAELRGKTPRELDLEIWLAGSGEENKV